VIIDSTTDMPARFQDRLETVPLTVSFGDQEYLDGINLSRDEFYEKLESGAIMPKTSQATPMAFEQVYSEIRKRGQQGIVITVASQFSGTYQSACAAAAEYGDKVIVIDSRQFCISLYVLIVYACRLRDEGKTLEETAAAVEEAKKRVHVISVFATLEYLKLGGRISAAAAMAGSILSIKPVITIIDGVVEVIGKARGSKKANNMLVEFIDRVGGVDFDMPYCLGYTGFSEEVLTKYINDHAARYKEALKGITVVPVGATVGTYAGPGAVALAFFNK
jgi:DegV family protein with EDD domain